MKGAKRVSSIFNKNVTAYSPSETKKLGRELASRLRPGDVVFLCGELGSGKTTFVQGMVKGLGLNGRACSPSFIVANEITSKKLKFYHIDLYRLGPGGIDSFGLEHYFDGGGICAVEWADKLNDKFKPDYRINFKWLGENKRSVRIKALRGSSAR